MRAGQMRPWRIVISLFVIMSASAIADTIYVDGNANGGNNGSSWADAFTDLQVAMDSAINGDQVRVATGLYRPAGPGGSREMSFVIPDGVTMIGGFAGSGFDNPDKRDVSEFPSILSGDLNGDDVAVEMPEHLLNEPTRQDNSHHVVKVTYLYPATPVVLDGFTVTGGNANGDHYTKTSGGGIEARSSVFSVRNCIIEFNSALDEGGGCSSARAMSNCVIRNNSSRWGGGLYGPGSMQSCVIENNTAEIGGGIAHPGYAEDGAFVDCVIRGNRASLGGGLHMTNEVTSCAGCVFIDNQALHDGGAIYIRNDCTCRSELSLDRCKLIGNSAAGHGGALYQEGNPRVRLSNSLACGNNAGADGGGLFCDLYQGMIGAGWCGVTNSTIVSNTAIGSGGGLRYVVSEPGEFSVFNSILWANTDHTGFGTWDAQFTLTHGETETDAPSPTGFGHSRMEHNCIQGWNHTRGGQGNIGNYPLFQHMPDPAGHHGNCDGDYHLRPDSPCINAGSNSGIGFVVDSTSTSSDTGGSGSPGPDLDGNPRIVAGTVDMGAYEYQSSVRRIVYVDIDARGTNSGHSWADAHMSLREALLMASAGDEIRVAEGIYRPNVFVLSKRPSLGRSETFELKSGVTVRGGYAGLGQPDPNTRDITRYRTVLSGDLEANDQDPNDSEWEAVLSNPAHNWGILDDLIRRGNRGDNAYTVVTGSGTDHTAVLDGFTITAGQADGNTGSWDGPQFNGAGMYNLRGSPTLVNCVFLRNTTCGYGIRTHGAGLFNSDSNPLLRNCSFIQNVAWGASALARGGAIFDVNSTPVLADCLFRGNIVDGFDSDYYGGALYERDSNSTFTNCLFVRNCSEGGAIILNDSQASFMNCTFAGSYPAISCDSRLWGDSGQSRLEVANCIFADGTIQNYGDCWADVQVTYSNVRGGWPGTGNIDADPCFVDPGYWPTRIPDEPYEDIWIGRGDYHLKSQAGRWDPTGNIWVQDEVTSPCIDAGAPASPIGPEPFPNGGVINMGAYGGTTEASKSWFGGPLCTTIVAGDINGDCKVDFADFAIMAQHWCGNHIP